jgi:PKD repeat protein
MDVSGWAWSQNIGWISFRGPNYGVTLGPVVDGVRNLTGYAWSSNIGWISFNPAELIGCPSSPCNARVNPVTGEISGWARVLAHGGGWDGWIRMRGPGYGVSINFATREFSGWAWSNMVSGWISFRGPGYGVTLVNVPPEAREPLVVAANHCLAPQRYIFSWTFHDSGDTQSRFHLQVATSPANLAVGPYFINDTVTSSTHSYAPLDLFAWNTAYFWRVRVWDSFGAASPWSTINSFTTPIHVPPRVGFSWSPVRPVAGEVVQFTDNSECFGSGGTAVGCAFWAWDFNNDGITDSTLRNPTTTFTTHGAHPARLTVTDPSGFSCSSARRMRVDAQPPEWIEIPPFIWLRQFWASII